MQRALLLLLPYLPLGAGETVLGAYIFHRHGDRTSKSYPPVLLTAKGIEQSRRSGEWYRNRYVSSNASARIHGISSDTVTLSQLSVISPVDDVLHNSAQAFLQGLYPPLGKAASSEQSVNGDVTDGPLAGYQYIPINAEDMSTAGIQAEDNLRIQSGSACPNALASTESYLNSSDYLQRLEDTRDFYQRLLPVFEDTFPSTKASFEHAYGIYDLVHVSTIHNDTSSISHTDLITPEVQLQLYTLASEHEWGLAYNSSEPIRAVAGSLLAGQIVRDLNATLQAPLSKTSANRLTIQFGPYATFLSFFGLSQAMAASPDFYGIVDYDSSFVIELVANSEVSSSSSSPSTASPDEVQVRFLFANGTASDENPPKAFPLFGQKETTLKWSTFVDEMNKFSIGSREEWCVACGSQEGVCAGASTAGGETETKVISDAVAGVVGAVVTLIMVTGFATLAYSVGKMRAKNKRRLDSSSVALAPGKNTQTSRDDVSVEKVEHV